MGCSKQDVSRWENNPCSTQAQTKNTKLSVILKASVLFGLTENETEALANKAGLSLSAHENGLAEVLKYRSGKYHDLLRQAAVSERMFQYYMAGKTPTKQALLALAISLGLSLSEIDSLLHKYGYCLSRSLSNDAVVLWFLTNDNYKNGLLLLHSLNEVLDDLGLPILMTKLINR